MYTVHRRVLLGESVLVSYRIADASCFNYRQQGFRGREEAGAKLVLGAGGLLWGGITV
jgi:hypothetical protein